MFTSNKSLYVIREFSYYNYLNGPPHTGDLQSSVLKTGVQLPRQDASYIPSLSFLKLWCGLKQKFRWKVF